jgi:hypothetical protein
VSGTQVIAATIQDELARSRRRGWTLLIAIGLAFVVAWMFPRLDQTTWSIPPAILAVGLLGGAIGAAHRQRMFGRQRISQLTSAVLTVSSAAALLAVVLAANRLLGTAPGASPIEQGMLWIVEQGISPFAPVVVAGIVFLAWIAVVIESQRDVVAEAAAWRASHGPDGFTPLA